MVFCCEAARVTYLALNQLRAWQDLALIGRCSGSGLNSLFL